METGDLTLDFPKKFYFNNMVDFLTGDLYLQWPELFSGESEFK